MATIPTNPLSGINFGKKNITDSSGNILLSRKGTHWSEDDQMGFDLLMQSMQNDFNLGLMQYENEYNSPAEQARRMREAGLNPDILGLNGERASEAGQNVGTPNTQLNAGATAQRFTNGLFTAFQMAEQFVNSYSNFKYMGAMSDTSRLSNAQQMDSLSLSYILDQVSPDSVKDSNYEDKRVDLLSAAESFGRTELGLTRKQSKSFALTVSRKLDSPSFRNAYYKSMNEGASNRNEYLAKTTGDLYSDSDESMRILLDEVVNMYIDRSKSSMKADKAQFDDVKQYHDSFDASQSAVSENAYNRDKYQNYDTSSWLNHRKNRIVNRLGKSYKNGNVFSGILLGMYGDVTRSDFRFMDFGPTNFQKGIGFLSK